MSVDTSTGCKTRSSQNNDVEDDYRLHRRFDRIGRLVGDHGMARLMNASVMVVGLGGVGSFAAESLVRSGVKKIRIVDFDKVCVTNSNRQLQAMKNNVGQFKAGVLAERLQQINPQLEIDCREEFYNESNSEELLSGDLDFVVDAIDNVTAKCHLIATCKAKGIPLVVSTGSAGRIDPTRIQIADLADTRVDKLASVVRQILRQRYDFPREGKKFGIPAVFSDEAPVKPYELTYDRGEGFRCVCPGGSNEFHSCDMRNLIYGTAGFVTGSFGMTCASVVVRSLLEDVQPKAEETAQ
jgi:tRNA A37 threonylcarbamoyladenosine dehydratase